MLKSRIQIVLIVMLLLAGSAPLWAQTVAAASDEPKLIAVLKDANASRKAKSDACRQLAVIGTKDAIPTLAALLSDPELSHNARYALEPMPDAAVDEVFRKALGELEGKPLIGVLGSIGARRDAEAVDAVVAMFDRPSVGTPAKRQGLKTLGSIGTVQAGEMLKRAIQHVPAEGRMDLYEAVFRCAEHLDYDGHREMAMELYDTVRGIAEAPYQVRAGALRGAILIRGKAGVHLLAESLKSDDYVMFTTAVQTSQVMPDKEVTQTLTAALKGLPDDNKIVLMQSLGLRNDNEALPALCEVAKNGSTAVRVAAIEAMAAINVAYPVPDLVELMGDSDDAVAAAAQEALASLPGKTADDAAVKMFAGGNVKQQRKGLELMERRRMTGCVSMLIQAVGDADDAIRADVIKSVGQLGGPDQLGDLLDILMGLKSSGDIEAARQAISSVCGKAKEPRSCSGQLIAGLKTAGPAQKVVLLRVLSGIGGPSALKAVRKAVDDSNREVHAAAIRALGAWPSVDAATHLLALAKEADNSGDRTLCLRAYLGMARRRGLGLGQKLTMCQEAAKLAENDNEKRDLLGTLGSIDSPKALDLTTDYLSDSSVRQEAALASLTVAERLLKSNNAANHAGALVGPLEKVVQAGINDNVTKRAKDLLAQAKSKAN